MRVAYTAPSAPARPFHGVSWDEDRQLVRVLLPVETQEELLLLLLAGDSEAGQVAARACKRGRLTPGEARILMRFLETRTDHRLCRRLLWSFLTALP